MRFSQTIALITGAGSGIGKATAIRLADEGAKVILVGRTKARLEAVAKEINETKRIPMAEIFQADVSDEEDVKELVEYVNIHFGDLHILIHNAGTIKNERLLETSEMEWVRSVFHVSKMLGSLMVNKEKEESSSHRRSIVNVASFSGFQAGGQSSDYSTAKAEVIEFTREQAMELAPYGIRVNSVSPGLVDSPGLWNEKAIGEIPLGRMGHADEIANVIAFLASEEASYMTGTDVPVDGGLVH